MNTTYTDEQPLAAIHLAAARALAAARPAYAPEALAAVVSRQLALPAPVLGVGITAEVRDSLRLPGGLPVRGVVLRCPHEPPLAARLLLPPAATRLVLWLPGQGMAATLRDSTARLAAYYKAGTAVLLADLRGLGETTDPAAFNDAKYYNQEYRPALLSLHVGRPLLAQRVTDVGTLLHFLRYSGQREVAEAFTWPRLPLLLRADGPAALVALHAALLDAQLLAGVPGAPFPSAQVQASGAPPSFQYYLENPTAKDAYSEVLPGVLRYYDVPDLRRALGSRLLP